MSETVFVIPGDIDTPTGGYSYDRRVLALLPSYGIIARHMTLPGAYPSPSSQDLETACQRLTQTPATATLLIDGLAYGVFPQDFILRLNRRIIALVHHPLCLETGLTPAQQAALRNSETAALAMAQHIIATSPSTARTLIADFGVAADKVTVALPGTDPASRATGTGMPIQLLAVGAISKRKGYEILVAALAPIASLDWRLTIAGPLDRDRDAVDSLQTAISETRLDDQITLSGAVVPATLDRFYDSADLFIMPSHFEGYGMVLAEAMARGLPIVTTTGGAATETVPDAAALKVPPGDADALSQAISTAIRDKKLRTRLADASWEAGRTLPTWNETARRVAATILGLHV